MGRRTGEIDSTPTRRRAAVRPAACTSTWQDRRRSSPAAARRRCYWCQICGSVSPFGELIWLPARWLPKMLITLCYVYLWVRFQKCYSLLIRNRLCRPNSSSFSFSLCSSPATAPHSAPDSERHTGPPLSEDSVFLQLGDRAVYVTEPQVGKRAHVPCMKRQSHVWHGVVIDRLLIYTKWLSQRKSQHTTHAKVLLRKSHTICAPTLRNSSKLKRGKLY